MLFVLVFVLPLLEAFLVVIVVVGPFSVEEEEGAAPPLETGVPEKETVSLPFTLKEPYPVSRVANVDLPFVFVAVPALDMGAPPALGVTTPLPLGVVDIDEESTADLR